MLDDPALLGDAVAVGLLGDGTECIGRDGTDDLGLTSANWSCVIGSRYARQFSQRENTLLPLPLPPNVHINIHINTQRIT